MKNYKLNYDCVDCGENGGIQEAMHCEGLHFRDDDLFISLTSNEEEGCEVYSSRWE